jgi:hypothetical protein
VTTENDLLRAARERISSPSCPDEALSRQELADRVNAYIYNHHKRIVALDAGYFGKLERGVIRWPGRLYREAPRAVLEVPTDAQLGFSSSRRTVVKVVGVNRGQAVCTAGLGLGGLALSAMAPVAALLEGDEPTPIPSRVGATDIEYIRDAAGVFESWDFRFRVMCQIKLASLTMVTATRLRPPPSVPPPWKPPAPSAPTRPSTNCANSPATPPSTQSSTRPTSCTTASPPPS